MAKLMVINVLAKNYFQDCHIVGSKTVSLDKLQDFAQTLDKKTPIVVYCASYHCPLSQKAWLILDALGFSSIWAYEGGMAEWNQLGYPSAGACQEEYLNRQEKPRSHDIKTISAQDLKKKMEEAGLL